MRVQVLSLEPPSQAVRRLGALFHWVHWRGAGAPSGGHMRRILQRSQAVYDLCKVLRRHQAAYDYSCGAVLCLRRQFGAADSATRLGHCSEGALLGDGADVDVGEVHAKSSLPVAAEQQREGVAQLLLQGGELSTAGQLGDGSGRRLVERALVERAELCAQELPLGETESATRGQLDGIGRLIGQARTGDGQRSAHNQAVGGDDRLAKETGGAE